MITVIDRSCPLAFQGLAAAWDYVEGVIPALGYDDEIKIHDPAAVSPIVITADTAAEMVYLFREAA